MGMKRTDVKAAQRDPSARALAGKKPRRAGSRGTPAPSRHEEAHRAIEEYGRAIVQYINVGGPRKRLDAAKAALLSRTVPAQRVPGRCQWRSAMLTRALASARRALAGDSNDAEHDALVGLVETVEGLVTTIPSESHARRAGNAGVRHPRIGG